jgi:hypothetical protein
MNLELTYDLRNAENALPARSKWRRSSTAALAGKLVKRSWNVKGKKI